MQRFQDPRVTDGTPDAVAVATRVRAAVVDIPPSEVHP